MSEGGETMNSGAQGAGQPTPMQGGTLVGRVHRRTPREWLDGSGRRFIRR